MNRNNSDKHIDWISQLSQKELPAITSVANILDNFANDDTSSIPKLSNALLYDQGLSSCILRVANSALYMHNTKITTVSRASTILGISSVKNICLTSKVLDGLLKSKNIEPDIYEHLAKIMAHAFHAALLSKMMLPNHSDELQEEVYLAALMYHIGETTFWSTNNKLAKKLIKYVGMEEKEFKLLCFKTTGLNFNKLTVGLAEKWNLGTLLMKSFDDPESRSIEIQTISQANMLSSIISSPEDAKSKLPKILKKISLNMGVSEKELTEKISLTGSLAKNLLQSYGASVLIKYINNLPNKEDPKAEETENESPQLEVNNSSEISNEKQILELIQTLSKQCFKSKNINDFIHIVLKDLSLMYKLDCCTFWIYQQPKQLVIAKSSAKKGVECMANIETIHLNGGGNVITKMFDNNQALLVNNLQDAKWQKLMSLEVLKLMEGGVMCLSPVKIGDKKIGFISAQRFDNKKEFQEKEFSDFKFIIEHFNMCLSIVLHP